MAAGLTALFSLMFVAPGVISFPFAVFGTAAAFGLEAVRRWLPARGGNP
jgi:hypothetical protein